jgi:hypothetical protein
MGSWLDFQVDCVDFIVNEVLLGQDCHHHWGVQMTGLISISMISGFCHVVPQHR